MWIVIGVVIATFVAIITEKLRAELAALTGCCVLLALRVLSAQDLFPSRRAARSVRALRAVAPATTGRRRFGFRQQHARGGRVSPDHRHTGKAT